MGWNREWRPSQTCSREIRRTDDNGQQNGARTGRSEIKACGYRLESTKQPIIGHSSIDGEGSCTIIDIEIRHRYGDLSVSRRLGPAVSASLALSAAEWVEWAPSRVGFAALAETLLLGSLLGKVRDRVPRSPAPEPGALPRVYLCKSVANDVEI